MGDRYHSVVPAHDDDENFAKEVTGRLEQRRGRQVKLKPDSHMRGQGLLSLVCFKTQGKYQ